MGMQSRAFTVFLVGILVAFSHAINGAVVGVKKSSLIEVENVLEFNYDTAIINELQNDGSFLLLSFFKRSQEARNFLEPYAEICGQLNKHEGLKLAITMSEFSFDVKSFLVSYPHLRLYKDGASVSYSGPANVEAIVMWVKVLTSRPHAWLEQPTNVEDLVRSGEPPFSTPAAVSVYLPEDAPTEQVRMFNALAFSFASIFPRSALELPSVPFYVTRTGAGMPVTVDLLRNTNLWYYEGDEPVISYKGEMELNALREFVVYTRLPTVVPLIDLFNEDFDMHVTAREAVLYMLTNGTEAEEKAAISTLRQARQDYVEQFRAKSQTLVPNVTIFAYGSPNMKVPCDPNEVLCSGTASISDIITSELDLTIDAPIVGILPREGYCDAYQKTFSGFCSFLMNSTHKFTPRNILKHIDNFANGTATPYHKWSLVQFAPVVALDKIDDPARETLVFLTFPRDAARAMCKVCMHTLELFRLLSLKMKSLIMQNVVELFVIEVPPGSLDIDKKLGELPFIMFYRSSEGFNRTELNITALEEAGAPIPKKGNPISQRYDGNITVDAMYEYIITRGLLPPVEKIRNELGWEFKENRSDKQLDKETPPADAEKKDADSGEKKDAEKKDAGGKEGEGSRTDEL